MSGLLYFIDNSKPTSPQLLSDLVVEALEVAEVEGKVVVPIVQVDFALLFVSLLILVAFHAKLYIIVTITTSALESCFFEWMDRSDLVTA